MRFVLRKKDGQQLLFLCLDGEVDLITVVPSGLSYCSTLIRAYGARQRRRVTLPARLTCSLFAEEGADKKRKTLGGEM